MGRGGPRSSGNRIDGAPRGPRGSRGAPRSGGNKIDGGATAGDQEAWVRRRRRRRSGRLTWASEN